MKAIKIGLLALFIALCIGVNTESLPFNIRIALFGGMIVIGAMLIGGILVAVFMDTWETMEKDRKHGP